MEVIISIKNGMVINVKAPEEVTVVIRDYDTPSYCGYSDIEDSCEAKTDEYGETYTEEVWRGKECIQ
ncbi:MAG: hypothetical protein ABIN05_07845 [candidate division WOR-3 bacterium]